MFTLAIEFPDCTSMSQIFLINFSSIAGMSHECKGVWVFRPFGCLCKSVFLLTTNKSEKLCISSILCGEPADGFPSEKAYNVKSVPMSWHYHKITWYVCLTKHNVHSGSLYQTWSSTTHRLHIANGCFRDSFTFGIVSTGQYLVVDVKFRLVCIGHCDHGGGTNVHCMNVNTTSTREFCCCPVYTCWKHHMASDSHVLQGHQTVHLQIM